MPLTGARIDAAIALENPMWSGVAGENLTFADQWLSATMLVWLCTVPEDEIASVDLSGRLAWMSLHGISPAHDTGAELMEVFTEMREEIDASTSAPMNSPKDEEDELGKLWKTPGTPMIGVDPAQPVPSAGVPATSTESIASQEFLPDPEDLEGSAPSGTISPTPEASSSRESTSKPTDSPTPTSGPDSSEN